MDADNFPSLFWSGEHPGDDFDPNNILHGLFRGYMLVRVGRHIFLGPSHALGGDSARATRTCNAILHSMTTVEAEHLAYICVQVSHIPSSIWSTYLSFHRSQARFTVSSKSQWCESDGVLSYFKLYRTIVSFIRDAIDTEWKDDLLKWRNKSVSCMPL
jgi:hypothetical protein